MRPPTSGSRAALRAVCLCLITALSGCALFHHERFAGCTQRPFQGDIESGRGLVVPAGLSAPDTRNGVKIPAISVPETTRSRSEPCLAEPPSFAGAEAEAMAQRAVVPAAPLAPLPTPAATPLTTPTP